MKYSKIIPLIPLSLMLWATGALSASQEVKFMTWNIWHGSQDRHLAHDIESLQPNVMVLQETYSRQDTIKAAFAKANNIKPENVFSYTVSCFSNKQHNFTGAQDSCFPGNYETNSGNGSADNLTIWSIYPITDYNTFDVTETAVNTPKINQFNYGAVKLDVKGTPLWVANFWLTSSYGAEQYLNQLYIDKRDVEIRHYDSMIDEKQAIKGILDKEAHRADQAQQVVEKSKILLDNADKEPIIMAGDGNSFSHLDWAEKWRDGHYGLTIPFPVSQVFMAAGLKDSYREAHPNPLIYPCSSWQPQAADTPKPRTWSDREPTMTAPGRIDYIYYKGSRLSVKESVCVGSVGGGATGGTSDHAAVMTTFILN
ncbi:endonuclease/exonuclease/phosphatase family protein [Klebsiella sp. RHBSTW-00484]|uniref:endonuclease/exonuclease/phosphatase family protein n=1 Tax=unclassified Klebsiella TaxID=2608929 RepID=UPI0015E4D497|nr:MULTISPECIES: endonuclease/exonuclease/phosphatase family protein [unclassified Klebsiella]MBA7846288.1 endonuclease/exonuclease/phosphatase family protein [Klebsiella sp. RHBSTW-00465]QLO37799.1 endonuclease/exonuclease/phosphatase family protein [Klebsiella sp. RHBSTW-00484]QLT77318.1 endonuclease/exonuclease/phosphatase family protein [Klebsiella sp. RHBSTW-00464]